MSSLNKMPKKLLLPYLVLRGIGAMAVGVTVVFGLFLGTEIYVRFNDELAAITAAPPPAGTTLQAFPQDTASLQTMARDMVKDTTSLAASAAEMQDISPAAGGDTPSTDENK